MLSDSAAHGTVRHEDGALLEPRIVNGPHAFNSLHSHGADVCWSLVYYAETGTEEEDACECGEADANESGGALLLKTSPRGYYPVLPQAGELIAFPGTMEHAVMPRELPCRQDRDAAAWLWKALSMPLAESKPMRVSVACNVYSLTSAHRDKTIGYDRAARGPLPDLAPLPADLSCVCAARRK